MAAALHSYDRLIAAHFTDDQARAILDAMAGDLVTKEYFDVKLLATEAHVDAKLASLKTELLLAMFGSLGLILDSIYFVLPRLVHA